MKATAARRELARSAIEYDLILLEGKYPVACLHPYPLFRAPVRVKINQQKSPAVVDDINFR